MHPIRNKNCKNQHQKDNRLKKEIRLVKNNRKILEFHLSRRRTLRVQKNILRPKKFILIWLNYEKIFNSIDLFIKICSLFPDLLHFLSFQSLI